MNSDLIDHYEHGGLKLKQAIVGLLAEDLDAYPVAGAWSIRQIVAHLVDSELVYADRMKRVIAEDRPSLLAFDENAWIDRLGSQAMPVEEAVNLFAANRQWMTRVLRRCTEADFARVGVHSEAGPQTLAEIVTRIAHHVDHHLKFLYAKRANLGVSLYPRYTDQ